MMRNLGPVNAMYPSLTTIVGVMVDGKPNFSAIAHVGIMNHGQPQYVSVGINKKHHSPAGIHANREFSVCVPSQDMVAETDFVGLVSGRNCDKAALFSVFYGELEHAPMIEGCPVCMECRLHSVVDFTTHDVFIGEIVATHADESVLDGEGGIDIARVRPLLFDMTSRRYWSLGAPVAKCWNAGRELKQRFVKD